MADILRVHDWSYVRSIQHLCASIPDIPSVVGHLDGDTAISNGTFRAAQVAVGGICKAVDQVVTGQVRHVIKLLLASVAVASLSLMVIPCCKDYNKLHLISLCNLVALASSCLSSTIGLQISYSRAT